MRWLHSLHARLLLTALAVLLAFTLVAALALEHAFDQSLRETIEDRLQSQVFGILSTAEESSPGELSLPETMPEKRFNELGSGLYGYAFNVNGERVWRSESSLDFVDVTYRKGQPGTPVFTEKTYNGERFLQVSYTVIWEHRDGETLYTLVVTESRRGYLDALAVYRKTLWTWLAALVVGLLLVQLAVVRWGLKPLRLVSGELARVEAGMQERLESEYPREISRLTHNINLLVSSERAQRQRYQDTLGNLAHSLKTPLAVLQTSLQNPQDQGQLTRIIREQLGRMNQIVGYQLSRAASSGPVAMARKIALKPQARKILNSLNKVYADKELEIRKDIPDGLKVSMDTGDLLELLGNLLDNACKFARRKVLIRAQPGQSGVLVEIHDDGPGIPAAVSHAVLTRGARLDEAVEGQGIGLAMVADILRSYDGDMAIETSSLGGSLIRLRLP